MGELLIVVHTDVSAAREHFLHLARIHEVVTPAEQHNTASPKIFWPQIEIRPAFAAS